MSMGVHENAQGCFSLVGEICCSRPKKPRDELNASALGIVTLGANK